MIAQRASKCRWCADPITPGQTIRRVREGWAHDECAPHAGGALDPVDAVARPTRVPGETFTPSRRPRHLCHICGAPFTAGELVADAGPLPYRRRRVKRDAAGRVTALKPQPRRLIHARCDAGESDAVSRETR